MNNATKKLAKQITTKLKGIDQKSAVEQMATYFAIGHTLGEMDRDRRTYGSTLREDIVSLVPHLRDETRAREIMNLTYDEQFMKFVLEEAVTPMNSGQHLTLEHWCWLHRNEPEEQSTHNRRKRLVPVGDARQNRADGTDITREAWRRRELEWLRKESPTVSVLEHVEAMLEKRHEHEQEEFSEKVKEAIGMLEAL